MKKFLNGKMVEMTEEEIKEYNRNRPSVVDAFNVSDTERIEALEAAILELVEVLLNG